MSNAVDQQDTVEFRSPAAGAVSSSRVQVDIGGMSHVGKVRENNEDHFLIVRFDRTLQTLLTNLPEGSIADRHAEVGYAMIVADGMGGRAGGEIASRLAITTLVDIVIETPDWIMPRGGQDVEKVKQRMAERFRRIDGVLTEHAWYDPKLAGMGTTMTVAASLGAHMILTHIGDSRAYVYREGQLTQLTRDQTGAQALADIGAISQDAVAKHPMRHILTHALGGGGVHKIHADNHELVLSDQDQVLLCSDGLSDMVSDADIGNVVAQSLSAQLACQTLVNLALQNGGKDNVTAVLARYHIPSE
jgi:protein phosphatase